MLLNNTLPDLLKGRTVTHCVTERDIARFLEMTNSNTLCYWTKCSSSARLVGRARDGISLNWNSNLNASGCLGNWAVLYTTSEDEPHAYGQMCMKRHGKMHQQDFQKPRDYWGNKKIIVFKSSIRNWNLTTESLSDEVSITKRLPAMRFETVRTPEINWFTLKGTSEIVSLVNALSSVPEGPLVHSEIFDL